MPDGTTRTSYEHKTDAVQVGLAGGCQIGYPVETGDVLAAILGANGEQMLTHLFRFCVAIFYVCTLQYYI